MSEFKEGDFVVLIKTGTKDFLLQIVDQTYTNDMYRVNILSNGQYGPIFKDEIRLATIEEIAAGHRIDMPSLPVPVGSLQELHPEFAKVLNENFLELISDDSHTENRIGPLCKSKDV
ncbi:hypothetical protein A1C50_RS16500 [Acinetobacter baumannii]|uniref:hypothetical protein n=1 Tax=Acinetobacter baumannii TaxID=470 RepID=UPI0004F5178B|nr:hypothetical protein [Acinetobacter baumannii]EHU2364961.1 hypothetical protein [Acinetobacter baumannii]KIA11829.1 hypothetical protein RP89_14525 [Acinetobacter baumannii]OTK75665.1 hypothetical protein B9X90_07315 [Acinetobacter baumannii]HEI7966865.1 hypothetical protein [Acinetobacter baumannii]HEM7150560.1 hypothetical protein [Acinetobacter baumannii]